ncbi:pre-mRNA-splicing factor SLU7 [Citrus sinensis]|uniref:Pre-mRNA-splicing factor SLU7 n=1 Tax=Citrus sinensis TaxID=2711 RepID=A0ACB8P8I2_CITSI|nr:pre-mRNA-splicing factor SLU7 [Citrus sinensis]
MRVTLRILPQVKKGVCGNGSGITGTNRDLRIREDIPKYLLILDENSAYYDPKNNRYRMGGQALEWKQVNIHAWKASARGQDIHPEAAPTQAELHYWWEKNIEEKKRLLKTEEDMPMELLFGESDSILNRDLAERILRAAN